MVGHKVLSVEPFLCKEGRALNLMNARPSSFRSCKTTVALELQWLLFPRAHLKPCRRTEQGRVVEDAAGRTRIRENPPFSGLTRVRKLFAQCGPIYPASPG